MTTRLSRRYVLLASPKQFAAWVTAAEAADMTVAEFLRAAADERAGEHVASNVHREMLIELRGLRSDLRAPAPRLERVS